MPFGEKSDEHHTIDFDEVYEYIIKPAVEGLDLECVRCDHIESSGVIQEDMLEMIRRAEVAVVDISMLNANVFYELGVRHTFHKNVTVVIQHDGYRPPFNICDIRVVRYALNIKAAREAIEKIRRFIRNGLQSGKNDSVVYSMLDDVRAPARSPKIKKQQVFSYQVQSTTKKVSIVTGDIRNVRDVDILVNSENTHMHMSRICDRTISAAIRHAGAFIASGKLERDFIADQLVDKNWVEPGQVVMTGPGMLFERGVKLVFHAAAVHRTPLKGYRTVANIGDCVTNALVKADSPAASDLANDCKKKDKPPNVWPKGLKPTLNSILFPLLGPGREEGR